jgi:ribose 1,5-bisphosphokinase
MHKGTLFYIIGASGVGKDSVINELKNKLTYKEGFIFTKRFITRPNSDSTEKHIPISNADFDFRLSNQLFALNWQANGNDYGIGIEIEYWLNEGLHVIVNGSRGYLDVAKTKYPELQSILIEVDKSILYNRLIGRNRESKEEIEQRLKRNEQFETLDYDIIINNESHLEVAVDSLYQFIRSKASNV